jgi:excisionase family DNA binding protein
LAKLQHLLLSAQTELVELSKASSLLAISRGQDSGTLPSSGEAEAIEVDEAAERLKLSRTSIYELMKTGQLRFVLVGHRRRIPVSELRRLLTLDNPAA